MRFLFFIIIPFFLISCQNSNNFSKFENRSDFIEFLKSKSATERSNFLKDQSSYIDSTIEKSKDDMVYFSFSMGLSSGNEKEINWDTVNFDNLDIQNELFQIAPVDSQKFDFESYAKQTFITQNFRLPQSSFTLGSDTSFSGEDDVQLKYKNIHAGKSKLDSAKIGLQRVDSITADLSYKMPVTWDSLIILPTAKSAKYGGYDLHIDTISNQAIEIDIPMELFQRYLDNRAVVKNGKVISTNSFSSMPLFGINPSVQEKSKEASLLFKKYGNKEISDAELVLFEKEFTDAHFLGVKNLTIYKETKWKELEDLMKSEKDGEDVFDKIKELRIFLEKNAAYFGPVEQRLTISFPYPVTQFTLYFAKEMQILKTSRTIPVKQEQSLSYRTVYDEEKELYGIVDSLGHIIIEPTYKDLTTQEGGYFFNEEDSIGYFLDVKTKKLVETKAGYRFVRKLTDEFSVFRDKKDYFGLLKNNSKEIVPFKYAEINLNNQVLTAQGSLRGRQFYEFYDLKGGKIDLPTVRKIDFLNDENIIVQDAKRHYGVLTYSGKLVVPIEFDEIMDLQTAKLVAVLKNRELFLMNFDGKSITLPQDISQFKPDDCGDGLLAFASKSAYNSGFIDVTGDVVIPAMYSDVTRFFNGHALAEFENNEVALIDKSNRKLKVLYPAGDENPRIDFIQGSDKMGYFVIEEKVYDANGNLTTLSLDKILAD